MKTRVGLSLSKLLIRKVDEIAKREQRTRSFIIENLFWRYVSSYERAQDDFRNRISYDELEDPSVAAKESEHPQPEADSVTPVRPVEDGSEEVGEPLVVPVSEET